MNKRDAAYGVVPILKDENKYLVIQSRSGKWGFPKGHAEGNEEAFEAALRELQEEVGISKCELVKDTSFSESYIFELNG
jgi:8-oxo-dGTP pyrophosphatase MutT (NUDIX family)